MGKLIALTGNEAVGEAMRQIDPDVVAAFPITPQTELMHKFAEYVANGEVDTEFILVESEHSAMSACIGASAAGARAMTATSACGFALMWEVVYVAASYRLPIVMTVVNRALSGPINIHCDHSDSMGGRDAGWIQIYSENSQDAYDNVIQAIRIAEHPRVRLPVMVMMDGFIISHTTEILEVLDTEQVRKFIGEYRTDRSLLDFRNPITVGPLDLPDYYFEHKRAQVEAMERSRKVILETGRKYERLSGRGYGFFETYRMEDARVSLVILGSTSGTAREVVDELRDEGIEAGLVNLRVFRPFPHKELSKSLIDLKGVGVLDRSISFGAYGGPLYNEVKAALYGLEGAPPVTNYIYGLGGRDINKDQIKEIYLQLMDIASGNPVEDYIKYVGVRERVD